MRSCLVLALTLAGCASGRGVTPTAAASDADFTPCSVQLDDDQSASWRQVADGDVTYCVPAHWKSAGARTWRGDGMSITWSPTPANRRAVAVVRAEVPRGSTGGPVVGNPMPGTSYRTWVERIGGYNVDVWESEIANVRRAGANWTTPRPLYVTGTSPTPGGLMTLANICRTFRI